MKKLLLPLLLVVAVGVNAQDRMTPELLWSLKRVSAEGIHPNGRTLYYSAITYDVKKEKSTDKKKSHDLK